jgi:ATP-dependent exoDNAse (exonuclease V) beta subunit
LDWSIDGKSSSFLLEENGEFVYTSLSKNSALDFIQQKYEVENQANMLDKINLCYVMFTRPVERLYICNFYNKSGNRFGKMFHNLISTSFGIVGESQVALTLGTAEQIQREASEDEHSNFNPSFINETLWFPEISLQKIPFQAETDLRKERRFGNQLHLLLSKVDKLEELDATLTVFIKDGSIESEFKDELRSKISEIFTNPFYTELHNDALQIAKEQEIIISPAETRRPDKIIFKASETIVVDYKTGIPNEKDKKQIKLYQSTLKKMGFEQVRAFLFYTAVMELVEY